MSASVAYILTYAEKWHMDRMGRVVYRMEPTLKSFRQTAKTRTRPDHLDDEDSLYILGSALVIFRFYKYSNMFSKVVSHSGVMNRS